MVIGKSSTEDVDDRRIALVAVETDMADWRHDSATDTQVTIFDGVYLLVQIDGSENFFVDPAVIRRPGLLSERQTSGKKSQSDERPRGDPQSRFHLRLLELNNGTGSVMRLSAFSFRVDRSLRVEGAERESEADVVDRIFQPLCCPAPDDDVADIPPGVDVSGVQRRGLTRFPGQYEFPRLDTPALLQEIERPGLFADGDDPGERRRGADIFAVIQKRKGGLVVLA